MFGLNPDETSRLKEGEVLNKRVAENNGYLNTGFVGTPLLCGALSSTGHNETAVSLLLNEDMPSWLYEVNMGATTIWERWNSVTPDGKLSSEGMNSLNYYSCGSIVAWMYKELAGIKASKAGYKRVKIEPKTDARLGFADCTMKTASGEYKVSWKYEGEDKVSFKIHVPFDCAAEFSFGNFNENFSCGNYNFSVKM